MTSGGAMKVYVAIMAGTYFAPRWSFGLRAGDVSRIRSDHRSEMVHPTPNGLEGNRHSTLLNKSTDHAFARGGKLTSDKPS